MNTTMRNLRQAKGFTQTDGSERAGVAQGTWNRMELGDCPLPVANAIRVARALGTTVEHLFGATATTRTSGRLGVKKGPRMPKSSGNDGSAPVAP